MNNIVKIYVSHMYETCERHTFYVNLISEEGFDMSPSGHATGSVYTDHKGLSIEEARDRALMDAHNWSDFLGVPVTPFVMDGTTYEPMMKFDFYEIRRELARRKEA